MEEWMWINFSKLRSLRITMDLDWVNNTSLMSLKLVGMKPMEINKAMKVKLWHRKLLPLLRMYSHLKSILTMKRNLRTAWETNPNYMSKIEVASMMKRKIVFMISLHKTMKKSSKFRIKDKIKDKTESLLVLIIEDLREAIKDKKASWVRTVLWMIGLKKSPLNLVQNRGQDLLLLRFRPTALKTLFLCPFKTTIGFWTRPARLSRRFLHLRAFKSILWTWSKRFKTK